MDEPEQLTAFDPQAVARRTDPVTSHEAARSVAVVGGRALILQALHALGPSSDEEIHDWLRTHGKRISTSGARTRRAELVAGGLVEDSGQTTKTHAGRRTIIWSEAR